MLLCVVEEMELIVRVKIWRESYRVIKFLGSVFLRVFVIINLIVFNLCFDGILLSG